MVYEVFGMSDIRPMTCSVRHAHYRFLNIFTQRGEAGGRGYFIAKPYTSVLEEVLAEVLPQRDVDLGLDPEYYVRMDHDYAGAVTYIHKVRGGKDIYFIANSTDVPVSLQVRLRGEKQGVELWDPHTGERSLPQDLQIVEAAARPASEAVTAFPLTLPERSGVFVVAE